MPELPETEVIAEALKRSCQGATLRRIKVLNPAILDQGSDRRPESYEDTTVQNIQRHGKNIILGLSRDQIACTIGIRLGMTGQLLLRNQEVPALPHTHAILSFVDRPYEIHFRDPRRFGRICLLGSPQAILKGVDALNLKTRALRALTVGRRGRIKAVLMNQNLIAGIGNIYANEILFIAGVHPHQIAGHITPLRLRALLKGVKKVLHLAIEKGGTTIRDFRSLYETPGTFQEYLKIYGKAGAPCPRPTCGGRIRVIRTSPQAQPSFYCPQCQRKR